MRGRNVEEAVYSIEFIAVEVYKHRVVWVSKFPGCLKIRFINNSVENSSICIILFNIYHNIQKCIKIRIAAKSLKKSHDVGGSKQQLLLKHHK